MRQFLAQNKRLVFTLIHKFRWPHGGRFPVLTERSDVVVIVDEAHRTQYKSLAENMRAGLPNASYLAFTGTPLLGRDRKTNEWFGDYVSEYTFAQSMEDGATVPLVYQKRVPQMQVQNQDLSDEFYQILEEESLDEAAQEKLEKRFATEMQVITRDDRLETIAKDIVYHFPRRGYLGKGMVIAYNAGSTSAEAYFDGLVKFTADLAAEDERALREGLTEDELEIFDLLCKDTMTQAETQKVKLAAKALLHRLNDETPKMLVQDWYKTDQTRLIVRSAVAEVLDRELPQDGYDRVLFQAKCDNVFHLVPDHAVQERKWTA